MIGNDIVDLRIVLPENNAANIQYLQKICTDKEIALINAASIPNIMLWRIWTMKEAAYKIASKKADFRLFNPKKFNTEIINDSEGKIHCEWGEYKVWTYINEKWINSIAIESDKNWFADAMETENKDLSEEVRKALIFSYIYNLDSSAEINSLEIRKNDNGFPYLYKENQLLSVNLSLSHHGKCIAWAFMENN